MNRIHESYPNCPSIITPNAIMTRRYEGELVLTRAGAGLDFIDPWEDDGAADGSCCLAVQVSCQVMALHHSPDELLISDVAGMAGAVPFDLDI
jgi:hypothetical protein